MGFSNKPTPGSLYKETIVSADVFGSDDIKLISALREFLWMAVCWNDHNFQEGAVTEKCRNLCKELGIETVKDANALLNKIEDY